ncbi:M60 family metallopeptidase [Bacteroides reticulotermitis]|nr:M60 family metallopeptidase [Bacteroides reticulotermitis]MBB4044480.1 hypothetical protein [Bacteroides reticulotermitis]
MKHTKTKVLHCIFNLLLVFLPSLSISACSDEKAEENGFKDDWISISAESMHIPYEGSTENRNFTLNEGINVSQLMYTLNNNGEDWCTVTLKNSQLSILVERSYAENERNTTLTLIYDEQHKCNIVIKQAPAPSASDKLIKVLSGVATSEETNAKDADNNPLTLKMSYDGNKKTFFNSEYGVVSYPFHITYELESGHILNSIVYTPRTDSGNKWGTFNEFSVEISTTDHPDQFVHIADYKREDAVHTPFTMKLPEGIVNAQKVRFVITKAYQDRVSCAEMEFFEASANRFDLSTIFANSMCTQLKANVTEKQIKQIPNEYLRALGLALLNENYNSHYRLADYRPYQHPSVMAAINKTAKYSLRDNPTGIYAQRGEKLAVIVDKIYADGEVSMLIQDLNGGYGNSRSYKLEEGFNEITPEVDGLIYILNHTKDDIPLLLDEAGEAQKKIIQNKTVQIHFAMGKVNGYFDLQRNKESDWKDIIENAQYQDIDVLGKYAHITWKVSHFLDKKTDIIQTIENFDRLVYLEQEFMGLIKYKKMFNNRMHFSIDYKASSPNATEYRTVYTPSYIEPFCVPERFAARCWGPAHEVGHCNQTRPGLKWAGTTEVTNNIMSLYIQTSFGRPCKLLVDGCTLKDEKDEIIVGDYSNIYEAAQAFIVEGKRAHCLPDINSIVRETQLVPFWQLKLYMIDVLYNGDFYYDLYEYFRTHESPSDKGENQGLNQLDFVRQVCLIANLNMLDFFEKWGFLTPVATYLNDYGSKEFIITQAQINDLKTEINGKGYPNAPKDLHLITEANLSKYK